MELKDVDIESGVCRICGCTDDDCSQCIERTGHPCAWADAMHTICTACASDCEETMVTAPTDHLPELPPQGHLLQKLGALLTCLLDEDQWKACERELLDAFAAEQKLVAAANELVNDAEEFEGPDGMMFGVQQHLLHALQDALPQANSDESPEGIA